MGRKIDSVLFDLDGTLWDSTAACARGWNEVLARRHIPFRAITPADIASVQGLSHEECVRRVFAGLPEPDIGWLVAETQVGDNLAVQRYGGVPYPGVVEWLPRIAAAVPCFIVSNCQAGYIGIFLEQTRLGNLISDHECWGDTRLPKADNIRLLVGRNGLRSPVMVGDGAGDRDSALACGLPFIHAAYGFGRAGGSPCSFASFPQIAAHLLAL